MAKSSIVVSALFTLMSSEGGALNSGSSAERDVWIQKSNGGDIMAVEALGKSKDVSLIPVLSRQLSEARSSKASPALVRALKKSLARLGDPASRNEIRQGIGNKNRYIQCHAFEDAADVGGDDMVAAIAEKLSDASPGGRPIDEEGNLVEDVSLPAPRHAAVVALSRMIDDPSAPRIDLKKITYNDESVQQWRNWWQANKSKFGVSH